VAELLEGGTEAVWVVRLQGPRRVEVHGPAGSFHVATAGESLTVPGSAVPLPVDALYDRATALDVALRNLLLRQGYRDLEEVREEGQIIATRSAIVALAERRAWSLGDAERAAIASCTDLAQLRLWLCAAEDAGDPAGLFR
jgi:hypothetical protein